MRTSQTYSTLPFLFPASISDDSIACTCIRSCLIPLEVCERIIDIIPTLAVPDNLAIENDKLRRATLLACALTCRAWLYRSRYHLHQDIRIFDKGQLERFVAVLRESPDVGSFVLNFSTGTRPQGHKAEDWVHLIPVYLAGPLCDLKNLLVQGCNWRCLHPSFFVAITRFTTVTRLVLQTVKLGSSRELIRMVFAFPSLKELIIREVECAKNRPCQLFKKSRRCLPLHYLLFRRGLIGYPLLKLFNETESNSLIRTLDMELNPEEVEAQALGEFIRGSTSMTYLFLQIPLVVSKCDPAVYDYITLENACTLQNFKYSCILSPSNFDLLVSLLRTVKPHTVQDMFVKFWGGWSPHIDQKLKALEEVDWTALDAVLSSSRFLSLRSLCIEIDYLGGLDALPKFLEKHLPKTYKRDIFVEEVTW